MAFILTYVDWRGDRHEVKKTLKKILEEYAGGGIGSLPLVEMALTAGTPTEDEKFLYDMFVRILAGGPAEPDRGFAEAVRLLEDRISTRLQESPGSAGATSLTELTKNLFAVEEKIRDSGVWGSMVIEGIHLMLFPDGSGKIVGTWRRHLEKPTKEQRLLSAIFTDEGDMFEFVNVGELEAWIVERLE